MARGLRLVLFGFAAWCVLFLIGFSLGYIR